MLTKLLAWFRPAPLPWASRVTRIAALPKAKPPLVKYEVPDARVRPKVRSYREWVEKYQSRKAG